MTDFGDTQVQGEDEREDSRRLSLQDNEPPAEVDGYTMIRRLGTGAYGTVWLAREDNTGRMVAIKYYPHRRGINWSLLSREVEKLARLYTSRNIVQLLDVGWDSEPPYYVMEFVENGPLSSLMARGTLSTNVAVRIAKEVCRALIEAHGAGVLHCDLKPDNVLLDAQQHVRLCDFGQSRMSHERSPALGTLYYMAPEQADLDAVADARWDVYAVGALLYHMLTGSPPYRTAELQRQLESTRSLDERLQLYRDAIRAAPRPAKHHSITGVDRRLARVIDACLNINPVERLPNAQAILANLVERDRTRARRPLLLLGVIAPLLLISAMVPIFANAIHSNVTEMKQRLSHRALESDALSARALAGALEAELEGRLTDLQDLAATEQFRELLVFLDEGNAGRDYELLSSLNARLRQERDTTDEKDEVSAAEESLGAEPAMPDAMAKAPPPWAVELLQRLQDGSVTDDNGRAMHLPELLKQGDTQLAVTQSRLLHSEPQERRPPWMRALDAARLRADDRNHNRQHKADTSWFLQDRSGIQVWRSPYAETVGIDWSTRDYFRGRKSPHVSRPFTSKATGQYMVALAVPVKNAAGESIGVLARTVHLADLRERLGDYLRDTGRQGATDDPVIREVALADARTGQLLDHPWLIDKSAAQLKQVFDALPPLSADVIRRLQLAPALDGNEQSSPPALAELLLNPYTDPIGLLDDPSTDRYRHEWMASMARMKHETTPWIVIVQEQSANINQPVEDMEATAVRTAWVAVVTSVLLMGIVWVFVGRAITRSTPTVTPVAR